MANLTTCSVNSSGRDCGGGARGRNRGDGGGHGAASPRRGRRELAGGPLWQPHHESQQHAHAEAYGEPDGPLQAQGAGRSSCWHGLLLRGQGGGGAGIAAHAFRCSRI